ncbi:MAG TPA: TetR/AcrR family transcriptional regulator [Actinomycetes bacterium]|jgi:AcrR family transcriptional regulator
MATPSAAPAPERDELRERLVDAGLELLDRHGPAELTVRRIAEAAGTSTMGVYTKFGGRTGVLEAIYRRSFELLREALGAVPPDGDAIRHVLDLALAYRRFAIANPALYAFMFEQPVPDFGPSPSLRAEVLDATFGLLVAAVQRAAAQGALPDGDPVHTSVLVWCLAHGMVSLELTHAARSPQPGWLPDGPEAGERILLEGVRATLLGHREPA